jgi:hypothetical protein
MIRGISLALSFFSCFAFSSQVDSTSLSSDDSIKPLPVNAWGLGFRAYGSTGTIDFYRTFAPNWDGLLALSNTNTHSDISFPGINGNDTNATLVQGSGSETTNGNTIGFWLQAQYDKPVGRGVDFTAALGPRFGLIWTQTLENFAFAENNATKNFISSNGVKQNTNQFNATGGLYGTIGFRWWFIPQKIALAGEVGENMYYSYIKNRTEIQYVDNTSGATYSSTYTNSQTNTYGLTSSWALGLDVIF